MSVHRQANQTWKVRYRIGTKQHSKSGFQTKREAEAYESEQLRRSRTGIWTDPNAAKVSVTTFFTDWIESKQIEDRTRYDYQSIFHRMIEPTWGHDRLEHITPAKVTRWVAKLADEYSRGSVQKALTIFSQLLDWAVTDERLAHNPVKRARELSQGSLLPRRGIKKDKVFLTHTEVASLAEAAGESGFMILFMAYTGLRFGEASALQIRDIDLLRNRLIVRRAFSETAGVLKEVPPKSGREREVPIPNILQAPLKNALERASSPSSLLFSGQKGAPLRLSNWRSRIFEPAARKVGLMGFTPHGLRHTYAALAVKAGANAKVLQKAMGHSDIRLTLDTYGGLFPDDLDALADGFDKAVSSTNVPEMFPITTEVVRLDRTSSAK